MDAGANKVICEIKTLPDNTVRVTIGDDGSGMSEDVLVNKFLSYGATTKTAGATIGGFGKAKELLLLPWISWEIYTRDNYATGQNDEYELEKRKPVPGTLLSVVMPADLHTNETAAISFIKKCSLPDIDFVVNGKKYSANLKPGQVVESGAGVFIFHNSHRYLKDQSLLVRVHGPRGAIYMFGMDIDPEAKGTYVAEVMHDRALELLTANRDGFQGYEQRGIIYRFLNTLAREESAVLRRKKNLIRQKFRGSGRFTAARNRELEALFAQKIGDFGRGEGRPIVLTEAQKRDLVELSQTVNAPAQPETEVPDSDEPTPSPGLPFNLKASDASVDAIMSLKFAGPQHTLNATKQVAYEPDFFIINEVEEFKVPRKFYPQNMSPLVIKMVRFWTELCRFILAQLNCGLSFGVGLYFGPRTLGYHVKEEGEHWLLMNPFQYSKKRKRIILTGEDAEQYRLTSKADIFTIYSIAVHECTHMADGFSIHDEAFAAALTHNFGVTAGKTKQIKQILRSITRR